MNAAQQKKYWWEWAQCKAYYTGRGLTPALAETKRHDLHKKALGRDVSSKALTNVQFDAVIAEFRAVWDGGNLDAQLAQIEQPERRKAAAIRRIHVLRDHLGVRDGSQGTYVDGIGRNLFGVAQYHLCDAEQLAKLEGVLFRRLYQLHTREKVAEIRATAQEHADEVEAMLRPAPAAKPVDGDDPF